ncbi:short-chain fatty acyl-CoA regulator family protein [Alphaproteobacteria bacterium]|jgi:predicted transcriptional regulator/DNA-binding XRE family transcriptional regulator|nr:short-chain fatty acyl-CoA regulator family protein [Pelagibacteraceae bacterium]MDC3270063.1 short-chain fatty acyl-CoA regulator family protein [Alphaproteobacteria bacterium]
MQINELSNIGSKIRKERRTRGFSQSELSKKLDISASYLNLLESGRRTITVPLLIKVGNELGLSLKDLTLESNQRILSDVMDVLSNEMFEDLDITNQETAEFISSNPSIAKALLALNDAHKSFKEDMQNRLESMDVNSSVVESPSRLPVEVVSDFLQDNKNYFHQIELASEIIRKQADLNDGHNIGSGLKLTNYLKEKHLINVQIVPASEELKSVRKFDKEKKLFQLSEMLTYTSRNFHLAYQVAYLESEDIIDEIINTNNIESEEVRPLLKISLLNYFASAMLMPYDDFLINAKKNKYDVEILMHHYACSFEQVTHRLTNLQKPGNEGVPFHFLKTDIAGNVSKRFSLSGIHIPRHGGSCPRWNVYIAFLNPGKIHPQISRMPDGKVYFCIARAFEKGIEKHGMPKSFVSIGLGCDVKYAKDLIYSEGMDIENKKLQTPIGVSCRICPRIECQQRAFPPIDKELKLDINFRGTSPYVTL